MKGLLLFVFVLWCAHTRSQPPSPALPEVNADIVAFVRAHVGMKVGRGECWDLAAEALEAAHAAWDGRYGYGKEVALKEALPGDIIQFEGVVVEVRTTTTLRRERYPHHTAVVVEVRAPGDLSIAHQNVGDGKRKVVITTLRAADVTAGRLRVHRPER